MAVRMKDGRHTYPLTNKPTLSLIRYQNGHLPETRAREAALQPGLARANIYLLDFDSCAGLFKLLLDGLGFFLGNAFLDRLGSSLNKILRFLQP